MARKVWFAVMVSVVAVAGLVAVPAAASECGEQIRLLDDHYSLAIIGGPTAPAADQTMASGAGGDVRSSAGMDTTPSTGGFANPRNTPVESLDAGQRERVRVALQAAKHADDSGDGTTCAGKVAEARRLVQGTAAEPRAR